MASRTYIIVGNKAATAPFHLNDLAGAAGRMDLLCRSVSAAFFLSHDLRRDVVIYLVLRGGPAPPRTIRISGTDVKYMSPDERNIAGLIRKALSVEDIDPRWVVSTPGIQVSSRDLVDLLQGLSREERANPFHLTEDGGPIDEADLGGYVTFLLGDHNGLTPEQEGLIDDWPRLSLGRTSYHTDHCITVLNHTIDMRAAKGR
jgi:tRNA (pseudouridine54-N1)-methyltransferase